MHVTEREKKREGGQEFPLLLYKREVLAGCGLTVRKSQKRWLCDAFPVSAAFTGHFVAPPNFVFLFYFCLPFFWAYSKQACLNLIR